MNLLMYVQLKVDHKEKGKEKGYVEANNSITSFVGSPYMGQ